MPRIKMPCLFQIRIYRISLGPYLLALDIENAYCWSDQFRDNKGLAANGSICLTAEVHNILICWHAVY